MTGAAGEPSPLRPVASEPVTIDGPAGPLEAMIEMPASPAPEPGPGGGRAVAVVCHPHPLHQGTMHNKVVHTLVRAFARSGVMAIRFNFRGVGASVGAYADGDGETGDALAVIDWALASRPDAALFLAGFSFGGMVAIRAASQRRARGLITVAPAIRFLDGNFAIPVCPWLVVQGEADDIVPAADVRRWANSLSPAPSVETLAGVGHFFHGALGELGTVTSRFLASLADASDEAMLAAERSS